MARRNDRPTVYVSASQVKGITRLLARQKHVRHDCPPYAGGEEFEVDGGFALCQKCQQLFVDERMNIHVFGDL